MQRGYIDMNRIVPNISVENCKEVLDYYKEVFGGEIKNLQMTDGKEMFKGQEGKILHAELHINADCILYLNDTFGSKTESSNISIILQLDSEDEINQLVDAKIEDIKSDNNIWRGFIQLVRFVIIYNDDDNDNQDKLISTGSLYEKYDGNLDWLLEKKYQIE